MNYDVNKCSEYAMKDENGNPLSSKTTLEGVTTLIESGTVSNAKPIYFHPLTLYSRGSGVAYAGKTFSFIGTAEILSNDNTALDNISRLYNYIISHFSRLNVTMNLYNITDSYNIRVVQLIFSAEHIYVIGMKDDGSRVDEQQNAIDLIGMLTSDVGIIDAVNKIN